MVPIGRRGITGGVFITLPEHCGGHDASLLLQIPALAAQSQGQHVS